MRTAGASALVTGGAGGLGLACVTALAARGASVVVADLDTAGAAERVAAAGGRLVPTDVADGDAVEEAATRAAELGPLRVGVACAGVVAPGRVVGRGGPLPSATFLRVLQVNLLGTFHLVRAVATRLAGADPGADSSAGAAEERGVLVLTSSVAAYDGQVGQSAYSATKAGVAGMALPLARELAEQRIRVVAIAPGTFDTPMVAGLSAVTRASLAAAVPHPARLGDPAEFAALVCHVVDNPMVNGTTIRLDGALRMAAR